MKHKESIIIFLLGALFLVPLFLLIRNIYFLGSPNFGDAPHFFSPEIVELYSEPLSWTQRGLNFGGVDLRLWISPFIFLYGALAKYVGLDSNLSTFLLFSLPGVILAAIGAFFLAKAFKVSIDVPSGINPDTGEKSNAYFEPNLIITMHDIKKGLESYKDKTIVADIGIKEKFNN